MTAMVQLLATKYYSKVRGPTLHWWVDKSIFMKHTTSFGPIRPPPACKHNACILRVATMVEVHRTSYADIFGCLVGSWRSGNPILCTPQKSLPAAPLEYPSAPQALCRIRCFTWGLECCHLCTATWQHASPSLLSHALAPPLPFSSPLNLPFPHSQIELDRKAARGVSFAAIADVAFRHGRRELAVLLLEREALASLQVRLLLRMGEAERAVDCAVAGADADLLMRVLLQLMVEVSGAPRSAGYLAPRSAAVEGLDVCLQLGGG